MIPTNKLWLPLISAPGTPPRTRPDNAIPFGYAIYGVEHERVHTELSNGYPVQTWSPQACCLEYSAFYPALHGSRWWVPMTQVAELAERYPRRTWLLWNEPDVTPPQGFIRPDYALGIHQEWLSYLRPHGHRIAGLNVTITRPDHWLNHCANINAIYGWRHWLEEWNRIGGPTPDVASIHIYEGPKEDPNLTPEEEGRLAVLQWQDRWSEWCEWNRLNWQIPTIISECGEGAAVYNYLLYEFSDPNCEALMYFTNFTDNPLPGLPPQRE